MSELKPCLSLEAAIEHAKERAAKLGDCLCAAEHAQLAEWLEELALRRAQPDNAPLTLDELRGMPGEWVWVTVKYGNAPLVGGYAFVATPCSFAFLEQWLKPEDYGKTWVAFRRKPELEGGTTDV